MKKSCMCMCGVFETWWLFKADPLNLPKFCITPQIDKHFQPHKFRYKNRIVISVKEFFYPLAVCLFVPRSINYKLNFEYNSVVCNIYRILFVVWLSEWVSERTNVKKPILQYQQIDIYPSFILETNDSRFGPSSNANTNTHKAKKNNSLNFVLAW